MFETDAHNNIGRFCAVRGNGGRKWRVKTAVKGGRYLVRDVVTGQHRVVSHRSMTSLY